MAQEQLTGCETKDFVCKKLLHHDRALFKYPFQKLETPTEDGRTLEWIAGLTIICMDNQPKNLAVLRILNPRSQNRPYTFHIANDIAERALIEKELNTRAARMTKGAYFRTIFKEYSIVYLNTEIGLYPIESIIIKVREDNSVALVDTTANGMLVLANWSEAFGDVSIQQNNLIGELGKLSIAPTESA